MEKNPALRRAVEVGALVLIGDGVMGLIKPRWHSRLWHFGPRLVKTAMEELAEHPNTARAIYLAELGIGIGLAAMQTPEVD